MFFQSLMQLPIEHKNNTDLRKQTWQFRTRVKKTKVQSFCRVAKIHTQATAPKGSDHLLPKMHFLVMSIKKKLDHVFFFHCHTFCMEAADPNQWEFDINTSHDIKIFATDCFKDIWHLTLRQMSIKAFSSSALCHRPDSTQFTVPTAKQPGSLTCFRRLAWRWRRDYRWPLDSNYTSRWKSSFLPLGYSAGKFKVNHPSGQGYLAPLFLPIQLTSLL